jgi:hypothetical protein
MNQYAIVEKLNLQQLAIQSPKYFKQKSMNFNGKQVERKKIIYATLHTFII